MKCHAIPKIAIASGPTVVVYAFDLSIQRFSDLKRFFIPKLILLTVRIKERKVPQKNVFGGQSGGQSSK
jgi:hypothetical protein